MGRLTPRPPLRKGEGEPDDFLTTTYVRQRSAPPLLFGEGAGG